MGQQSQFEWVQSRFWRWWLRSYVQRTWFRVSIQVWTLCGVWAWQGWGQDLLRSLVMVAAMCSVQRRECCLPRLPGRSGGRA